MIHRIKTYSIWLVCLFLSASSLVIGCSKDNIVIDFASNEDEFIERYSVSRATKHIDCSDGLKILSIGNSLGEDALFYLPDIVRLADVKGVKLGRLCCLGVDFKTHYDNFKKNNSKYTFYTSEDGSVWNTESEIKTIGGALNYETWDIVVFQDISGYECFQNYTAFGLAKEMVETIRSGSSNDILFFWHLPWSYGSGFTGSTFAPFAYNQKQMDSYISEVDKRLVSLGYGIIPTYETFASLRQSAINNPPLDLTRDGLHADYGAGRYSASCTWYQVLIYPFSHISIVGNPFRLVNGNVPVDDTVAGICQEVVSSVASKRESLF